jgi:16S rRNA (cytosine967-C5)-methyltransferase
MPQSLLLHGAGALEDIAAHRDGRFFVQDAGAALAVLAAAPKAGMCVLDGCAAPGGKSFLTGIRMESRGEILACDLREKKLSLIQDGAVRLGLSLIETRVMDAGEPDEVLRGRFDLVLADVPCSGLGVMRRKPEIRFRDPEELARLPDVQRRILRGLAACVAPGGTLLYSTCTVLEAENEGVVGAFLMENEEFSMEPFELPGIGKTGGSVMLWPPVHGTDGCFICRLRKWNV